MQYSHKNNRPVLRISKAYFLYLFLILWQFELGYFDTISIISTLFDYGKIVSLGVILLIVLQTGTFRPTRMFAFIVMYAVFLIMSTLANGGAVLSAVSVVASMLAMYLIITEMFRSNTRMAVMILMFLFEILIYANLVVMLLYPRGIYRVGNIYQTRFYWLFGHQNENIVYVLFALIIATAYRCLFAGEKRMVRPFLLEAASVVTVILTRAATGYVGLFIYTVMVLVNRKKIRITVFHGLTISIILFLLLVVLRRLDAFDFVITRVLYRNLTFSGRTEIWDSALYYIGQKPAFGYGLEPGSVTSYKLGGVVTPHNKILYVLYQGGVVLLIFFFGILLSAAGNTRRFSNKRITPNLIAVIFSVLVQMQMESYLKAAYYFPFFMTEVLACFPDEERTMWEKIRRKKLE